MNSNSDFVSVERVGDATYINLSCRYPQELCLFLDRQSIKRLASFFISIGKGKKKARLKLAVRAEKLSFPLLVIAYYRDDTPIVCFKYSYYNQGFYSVSDSFTCYDAFGKAALLRFGEELLTFDKTNKALLIEN